MATVVTYTGSRPLKMRATTVLAVVKLLEDEHLLDDFILATHNLQINLAPVTSYLSAKTFRASPLSNEGSMPAALTAARMINQRFAADFAATLADAEVSVPPAVINVTKTFLAEKGVDKRSAFGASIVSANTDDCPRPDQCPHASP